MSVADVISRISAIQGRFGVAPTGFRSGPSSAVFSNIADADDLPFEPADVGGARAGSALESLVVQRADLGAPGDGVRLERLIEPLPGALRSSDFGLRSDPFTGESRMHRGIDVGAEAGTPIVAAGPGVVTWAGERGSYGNLVVIDHGNNLETRYAHQAWVDVAVGDRVDAGSVIGAVGSTGRSTGPHLHFEVRVDGEAVDPEAWLVP